MRHDKDLRIVGNERSAPRANIAVGSTLKLKLRLQGSLLTLTRAGFRRHFACPNVKIIFGDASLMERHRNPIRDHPPGFAEFRLALAASSMACTICGSGSIGFGYVARLWRKPSPSIISATL